MSTKSGYRVPLFRWKSHEFNADLSLVFLFALLALSLRFRLFPFFYASLSTAQYWGMAFLTGIGIVFSVIAHEIIHVVVARRMGEVPHGLFLTLFGAGISSEVAKATRAKRSALYLSGILFAVLLSGALLGLGFLSEMNGRNQFVVGILVHLSAFNMTLAAFQLLPVLPLDGGRFVLNLMSRDGILRPWIVTAVYFLGHAIGLAFLVIGGYQVFKQRPVLGAWIVTLGLMLLKENYDEYACLVSPKNFGLGRQVQSPSVRGK